jgi:predicted  nucleic acid-binding Zn-ribbon protein
MKAELSNLVKLQSVDDEIRALRSRLAKIPEEVDALEREIASEKKNLEEAKARLSEAEKQQRSYESDLSMAEEKREKYKDQLMKVKSNDEYKAMQKQIEASGADIGKIEDKILQGMDAIEELKANRRQREQELEKGEREIAAMEKELLAEKTKLEGELASRETSRKGLLGDIPEELFEEYRRIASTRGGVGMAEALEERCQACMVRLRPQVYQELRLGEKLHHCESCKRILYYQEKEEAPTVSEGERQAPA